MDDQIVSPTDFASATFRTSLARVRLRMRRWIARRRARRGRENLSDLSDWILRDIGVMRERDMGTSPDADPREAARQFWRP